MIKSERKGRKGKERSASCVIMVDKTEGLRSDEISSLSSKGSPIYASQMSSHGFGHIFFFSFFLRQVRYHRNQQTNRNHATMSPR